jgi:hypothetical protein
VVCVSLCNKVLFHSGNNSLPGYQFALPGYEVFYFRVNSGNNSLPGYQFALPGYKVFYFRVNSSALS